jgi:hypothetical protein
LRMFDKMNECILSTTLPFVKKKTTDFF